MCLIIGRSLKMCRLVLHWMPWDLRAELMRNGTKWADVEHNREAMLKKCPDVDFYISPTVGIFNYSHVIDFHNDWMEKGFIKEGDLKFKHDTRPIAL